MVNGLDIIEEARRWLDVRWRHQGRSRHDGVDCVGLCLCVAWQLGIEIPDVKGYARRQDGSLLVALLEQHLSPVSISDGKSGDVAVFKDYGFPIHIGFLSEQGNETTVLHAHARRRKVLEEPLDIFGQPFALYRIKEME